MSSRNMRWLKRIGAVAATAATLAVAAPLAANAATPETTEVTVKKVVFDEGVAAVDSHQIPAFKCPDEAPYLLKARFPGDWMQHVMKGIAVDAANDVAVNIYHLPETRDDYVVGWGDSDLNTLTNWWTGGWNHVTITAHCTSDITKAYHLGEL